MHSLRGTLKRGNEYGPFGRWMIAHVYQAPGGWARCRGFALLFLGVVFLVVTIVLFNTDDALQSDKDFFPFITVFFFILSGINFVQWLVRWMSARRRDESVPANTYDQR